MVEIKFSNSLNGINVNGNSSTKGSSPFSRTSIMV